MAYIVQGHPRANTKEKMQVKSEINNKAGLVQAMT